MSSQTGNNDERLTKTWSTWEELLLAFAVKRHGFRHWDAVAMELRNRSSSLPGFLTAQICREKYYDLRRRFTDVDGDVEFCNGDGDFDGDGDNVAIPWLEELRQLRLAELRQEVQRYDLSIQSLQTKVKKMEEERDRSLRNDGAEPDLKEEEVEEERSEKDKNSVGGGEKAEDLAGDYSDKENRSFNESNSTENGGTAAVKAEPVPVETVEHTPEVKAKPAGEDSCNDSSDRQDRRKVKEPEVDSSKEGTKESSDVQSSASLTNRRRQRQGEDSGGVVGGEVKEVVAADAGTKQDSSMKSEPLVGILEMIRSHKYGSLFERRLNSQKTNTYKNMIRQHMDLQTVRARLNDGSYSACPDNFFLDLLVIFTNAIVFFPKSSNESSAAHELRGLIMKELKKSRNPSSSETGPEKPQPKPISQRPDSLLAQQKSAAPLLVCRKRSSISAKPASSGNKLGKQAEDKVVLDSQKLPARSSSNEDEEDNGSVKTRAKGKPVTGIRTMRRSSKGRPDNVVHSVSSNEQGATGSRQLSSADKAEDVKSGKKKDEANTATKKRGAADFLKRMKKNSPVKETLVDALRSSDNAKGSKTDQQKKKLKDSKDGPLRRSGAGGGGGRKPVEEEISLSKRTVGRPPKTGRDTVVKRGREGGGEAAEDSPRRPKKRSRR